MKRLLFALILMMTLPLITFSQNGQYDVRLNLNSYDCSTQQLLVDIDVRASSVDSTFRIAEQNYRFSYDTIAIDSIWIVEEGEISGFINHGGGTLGYSLYNIHDLGGTRGNYVSYNIELQGGDGLLIETEWVNVGTLAFSISDADSLLDIEWLTQSDFPRTFIVEKFGAIITAVPEGDYVNDIPIGTFNEVCNPDCPSGDITLRTQQEVNDFALNYPDCTELLGSLIIDSEDGSYYGGITDLSPLSQLTSVGGNLWITNNNHDIFNLTGLENLNSVGGDLSIAGNDGLPSLVGLENLSTVNGQLNISSNNTLSTLAALESLTTIGDLKITSNHGLSICNIPPICNYLTNNGSYEISNNGVGCGTEAEISALCNATAVCPPDHVIIGSQAELSNYALLYPNCTAIAGNLIVGIDNPFILSLGINELSPIISVAGNLSIIGYGIGGINDITDLANLTSVGGDLTFENTTLQSLSGLENLASINGKLVIEDNFDLTDITAIKDIDYTTINDLRIYNNTNLAVCHITSVCGYFKDNDTADIDRNATGCTNDTEVIETCALPIELTYLKAYIEGKNAIIHWQTATETNNEGFEIQKSSDGTAWKKIAWQAGQGNSDTPYEYSYKDSNPFFGTSYYRLKQIDFDGKYSHSEIVEVNYAGGSISIYPNPVKKTLYISDLNDINIKEIQIYNQEGKRIETSIANQQIDVSTLAAGIYILKMTTSNGVLHHNFLVE